MIHRTRRTRGAMSAAFAALALLVAGLAPAWPGAVTGTLIDSRSAPVTGARVLLSGPASLQGATDSAGAFSFSGLRAGTYSVHVEAPASLILPSADRELVVGENATVSVKLAAIPSSTTLISAIQGLAHLSPLNRETVTGVPGIVTAVRPRVGFYMQSPVADALDGTSEGILVATTRLATMKPGDLVLVDGRVQETYNGGRDAGDLSVTQIKLAAMTTLFPGVEVPAPVILGQGGRIPPSRIICDDASGNAEESPFDPENDGIDFFETLECMLVQVNDAVVVGSVHTAYGEFQVVGDGGRYATTMTRRGGLIMAAGDQNPERITVDSKGEPDIAIQPIPPVTVGDRYTSPIVGPLDYNYSDYKILPLTALPPAVPANLPRQEGPDVRDAKTLTVATLNIENYSATSAQEKTDDFATTVVTALHCPDLFAVEEVQDDSGSADDGIVSAERTYGVLIDAIARKGGPRYSFREVAPLNNQDGGEDGGNIRVGLLFNPERVRFVDRPGDPTVAVEVRTSDSGAALSASPGRIVPNHASFVASRKPLACELEFGGRKVFVVVLHLGSKSGDAQVYARSHPVPARSEQSRIEQAAVVNDFVKSLLAVDANAAVIVLGDCNEYTFAPAMLELKGAELLDLAEQLLPAEERYSYMYRGNMQDLDHILASPWLMRNTSPRVWILHRYSEYLYGVRQTDHDPLLAAFTFLQ